jgi:CRP-like cAMP-binding protein
MLNLNMSREMDKTNPKKQFLHTRGKPIHKMDRAPEPNENRSKLISFCSSELSSRSEEGITNFLHCIEKAGCFQFFQKYSLAQQRQLAVVAKLKELKCDEILFIQESQPDALYSVIEGQMHLYKMQGDVRKILAYAGVGESVGDPSHLDERCRRNVSAQVISEHCYLMRFQKQDLDSLIVQWRINEEEEKTAFIMKSVPILQCIPRSILQYISPYFEKVKVPKDMVIYHQQDDATIMYFVWEGQVQLMKKIDVIKSIKGDSASVLIPPKRISRSMSVAILSSGEYFGELEVVNNSLRCSAAVSYTDCTLLSLSKASLTDSMPSSFLDALFRFSTMRLQWRNSRICLIVDALSNAGWAPEKEIKFYLEPEIKPLSRMKSVLLPVVPDQDKRIWLGAHTVMTPKDAREWNMYHYGPWAQTPMKGHDSTDAPGARPALAASGLVPATAGVAALENIAQLLERKKAEMVRASFFSLG